MRVASKEYFSEHQKYIKLSAKIGILILALVFLLLPGILRESEFPVGDKPYYHLAKNENILGVGIGWNLLLKYFPMNTLLFVIGSLSLFFIFLNLKTFRLEERLLILSFFIVSPAFVYLFNVGERFGAAFLFSLVSSYFFLDKKYLIAGISTLLVFLFDIWIGFFVLLFFILYFLLHDKRKIFYFAVAGFVLLTLLLGGFNNYIISDLGAMVGSSIFALLFAVFCFLFFWDKEKFFPLYAAITLLLFFSFKVEFGIFYFSLFLSVLTGLCFFELLRAKWESKLVRDLILLIFICGFLFSGLSYVNRISKDNPNEDIFSALDRLPEGSVVFSDLEYGNWIIYSGKRSVWHSFMDQDEIDAVEKDFSAITDPGADYFIVAKVLEKYEVDYVLIDEKLRRKWQDSGLLYLLRYNNENFRFLFESNGVEVWRFFR